MDREGLVDGVGPTLIPSGVGFEARGLEEGSVFVFRVAQGRLFVIQDGKQIFVDPIIATL